MNNYVVTGGAGFIGSHLSERLLKMGHNVFVIDNFCDFYDPGIKRRNIEEIVDNTGKKDNLKLYEGDIRDNRFLEKTFREILKITGRTDKLAIAHIAAMAGVRPSLENPSLYQTVNIEGTLNLLEICKKFNIKNFLFASSSSVYGNNKKVPFSEKDPVDHPISVYAATKKSCELMCHAYSHLYDIRNICLRYFTVYGARQRPDLAIHKFTNLILKGSPIPVFGDGTSKRDYTYIDDIMDGTLKAIQRLENPENNVSFEIYNLGESRTVELRYLIEVITKHLGLKPKINRQPMQPGDVNITYADISKAREVLGYDPKVNIEEGIKRFVKWKLESESKILDLKK